MGRQLEQRCELRSCVLELEQRLVVLARGHLGSPYFLINTLSGAEDGRRYDVNLDQTEILAVGGRDIEADADGNPVFADNKEKVMFNV